MKISELIQWQWGSYNKYHRSSTNLVVHIVAVPIFMVGTILLVLAILNLKLWSALLAVALMVAAMAAQGVAHAREDYPPEPFKTLQEALTRIFLEQWFTFPRFVLSGRWYAALRKTLDA